MTTLQEETKKCAVCGNQSVHMEIISTKALGASDLDARPPEPERSSIRHWIQRCPVCGYCAPDIARGDKEMANIIQSADYRKQLKSSDYPELANSFLCWTLIQEEESQYKIAGWTAVKAAWACDDAGAADAARECRRRAITLLEMARQKGQWFADNAGTEEAVIVDLHRRSGQFEQAMKLCEERLAMQPDSFIVRIMNYQKQLIGKKDVDCHSTSEISGNGG
ncbi:MAG: hypothetical protein JW736_01295 [Deltaproteobacteria bacterium]|nr:hypothetical protein [Deltaproteobacteria bacterium]